MRDEVAEIAVLDIRLRIPREGFDGRPLLLRRARQAARRREEPLGAWYRHPPPIQSRARLRSSRIGSKRDLPLGFGGSSVLFGRNGKRRGVDEGRRTNKQRKRENNIYVFGIEITGCNSRPRTPSACDRAGWRVGQKLSRPTRR
jgi:hypothetical protein